MISLFDEANGLPERVKIDLSVQEEQFVRQLLVTHKIPSTKILIKYQKTSNEKEGFTTRLVIPATNFTITLSNIGYLEIHVTMYNAKVS